jgi:hypothetical protein
MKLFTTLALLLSLGRESNGFLSPPTSSSRSSLPSLSSSSSLAFFQSRGGASTSVSTTDLYDSSSDYSSSDDDEYDETYDVNDIDVVTTKDYAGQNAAKSARIMSNFAMNPSERFQLGKSYFLTSLLWLSITMDVVNNKKKRCLLIPGASEFGGKVVASNVRSTVFLALGFVLSAGISFLLSSEFKKEDKGLSSVATANDNDNATIKVDNDTKGEYFTSNEKVRKKLHLFIFLFSLINLGGNINPPSAPFLGMSGFVINIHNCLIAFSAWKKDTIVEGQTVKKELKDIGHSILTLFGKQQQKSMSSKKVNGNGNGKPIPLWQIYTSRLFSVATGISMIRIVNIIRSSLLPYYLAGSVSQLSIVFILLTLFIVLFMIMILIITMNFLIQYFCHIIIFT